jgi:hypothetical protein
MTVLKIVILMEVIKFWIIMEMEMQLFKII